MKTTPPLFSVVVPTYNRANFLPGALQSVLGQSYGDFEVVVSDDFSSDATSEVVKGFQDQDGRVRYVRTAERLDANEAWEYAVAHAVGEYVCVLPDDCALAPHFLERLAAVIRKFGPAMVVFQWARYYGQAAGLVEGAGNEVHVGRFTRSLWEVGARDELLRRFDTLEFSDPTPYISNACYQRAFLERIKAKAGGFCLSPSCEHVGPTMALGLLETSLFIDEPIFVYGQLEGESLTTAYRAMDPDFRKRQERHYVHVPLKGPFTTNWRAESLLLAKAHFPERFDGIDLNWENYFWRYYQDMRWFTNHGFSVAQDIEELHRALERQPEVVREGVHERIVALEGNRGLWKRIRRAFLRRALLPVPGALPHNESEGAVASGPVVLAGREHGFRDVLSCAQRLQSLASAVPLAAKPPMQGSTRMEKSV